MRHRARANMLAQRPRDFQSSCMRLPHDQDARRLAEIAEAARDCLLNRPAL